MQQYATSLCAIVGVALFLGGCQPQIYYQDPRAVETVTVDFGRTDLQTMADQMINSLLQSGVIAMGQRPVVYFYGVQNKTHEHIDTKSITDSIKVALVRSGRFQVTGAMEVPDELRRQLEYQTTSGMVNPATAARFGMQIGAQYFIYGDLTSIVKRAGRVEDVWYKFTLQLINVETAILDWADEVEISKAQQRAWFGR